MENQRNAYRLLRVQPDAPQAFITRVYRVLMQQLRMHPDLGGDTASAAHLNNAYRRVNDPKERAKLDQTLEMSGLSRARISAGPLSDYHKRAATARHNRINRRHYGRVLMLQLDAEQALLDAARSWVMSQKSKSSSQTLINRAYEHLSDSRTRSRYLELLTANSHNGALSILQQEAQTRAEALERSHAEQAKSQPDESTPQCPYCQLQPLSVNSAPEPHCARCASPLNQPPALELSNGRRQIARLQRAEAVTLRVGWPAHQYQAYLLDLSPHGVSFICAAPLQGLPVIRIDGASIVAVVELTHGRTSHAGSQFGGRFITVDFETTQGTFFQQSA